MRFALFCKSFRNDVERFSRLLDSAEQHNEDAVPFVLSVPRADRALFADRIGEHRVHWLCDEDLLGRDTPQSWRVQQLVKLYAARADFADAFFVLDSDDYFVKSYRRGDFISPSGEVAFVASPLSHLLDDFWSEVNEYLAEPANGVASANGAVRLDAAHRPRKASELGTIGWHERWLDVVRRPSHDDRLPRIQNFFGRKGAPVHYMPAPVWTRDSLLSFEREVLEPRALRYEDLVQYAPWESVWVGEWELFRGAPGRFLVAPYLLHIRWDSTILRAREVGLDERAVARRYWGLQLAARHQELPRLDPA